jgi:Na+/H+ antiporter NhaD/arsenite permease-like protein
MRNFPRVLLFLLVLILFFQAMTSAVVASSAPPGEEGVPGGLGRELPLWSGLPFVCILLSIALFPLLAPHFWHKNYMWVSLFWALVFAIPFLIAYRGEAFHAIVHIYVTDYIPFIILLGALYYCAGGILVEGTLAGTPVVNTLMLLIGTIFASWIGTTGASMVLIRPLLRANKHRRKKVHLVVFFIFLVSNIGGSLTPLGDPPLFLGFIHGVPFFWTFRILPHMGLISLMLLGLHFVIDAYYYRQEEEISVVPREERKPLRIRGLFNLLLIGGVLGGVLLSGVWHAGSVHLLGVEVPIQNLVRDALVLGMILLAWLFKDKEIRAANEFTLFPIQEVGYLFAGIFMTIIPVLEMLRAGAHGPMAFVIRAARDPIHYFWITGGLSSFLDNAPTYLTFFQTALGGLDLREEWIRQALRVGPSALAPHVGAAAGQKLASFVEILKAISAGAVFMGANTYIGNAPNFMVKSIAEESGVRMPSFFGYIFRWSLPILIPCLILVSLVFFLH